MCRFVYGMRLRGYSIGCQPMDGLIERQDDVLNEYHDILVYNRPLTMNEVRDYELDFLGKRREEKHDGQAVSEACAQDRSGDPGIAEHDPAHT